MIPLCVDLDGTLLKTDVLFEGIVQLAKERPWKLVFVPFWFVRGQAYVKHRVTELVELDTTHLPFTTPFLEFLQAEHARGRELILTTAADEHIARHIAARVGIFSDVIASHDNENISGRTKARVLVQRYGEKQFDYAGNAWRDLAVWHHAREGIVVNAPAGLLGSARRVVTVAHVFPRQVSLARAWLQALRPHQWVKNVLLVVPLLMAHKIDDPARLWRVLVGWAVFSLIASALYLLNDLLDLPSDRAHARKRYRPLAAGTLPIPVAIASIPLLLLVGIGAALLLPLPFMWSVLGYIAVVTLYSFYFKELVLVDVFVLASLYTLRVIAGAQAARVPVSFWLLAFAMFFFLSLALVKRFTELKALPETHQATARGRGYRRSDMVPIESLGAGSGYLSVLVLALYMDSAGVSQLYHHPGVLWLLCPLFLYWISRVWLLAHRGAMNEDPIIFAVRDMVSWAVGIVMLALLAIAI